MIIIIFMMMVFVNCGEFLWECVDNLSKKLVFHILTFLIVIGIFIK